MAARKRGAESSLEKQSVSKRSLASRSNIPPLKSPDMDISRVRSINSTEYAVTSKPVIYWMSRDQRHADNWALLYAQTRALEAETGLIVVFNFVPTFLGATLRQYDWMLQGLQEVSRGLEEMKIPFVLMHGSAEENIPKMAKQVQASLVVSDFSPLRIGEQWRSNVGGKLQELCISMHEVDAHNVVPAWVASDKIEYAARTIRRKLHERLPQYLVEFPPVKPHPEQAAAVKRWHTPQGAKTEIDWAQVQAQVTADATVPPVAGMTPGAEAANKQLSQFVEQIKGYATARNDPTLDRVSGLSPYLHFGQLSAQRAILQAHEARTASNAKDIDAFIEEIFVRRELSDNYCMHNQAGYDKVDGLYPQYANDSWAQKSLRAHEQDTREHVYTLAQLERGETHDELWNAAQDEMVHLGKMHGFMRMYWAKKILEWTSSPQEALDAAIYLNDRYSIDGRDPNGYVGIAWSIGGVHDQGWKERPVFGKVRYMNFAGCKRKFNVDLYISKVQKAIKALKRR